MENQFHERLYEMLDFNEEYVSNRIFVIEDYFQGVRMINDLSASVGSKLHVTIATPQQVYLMISKDSYPLYHEKKKTQDVFDKCDMISEAQTTLKSMEKWKQQKFVFLENFRHFGREMELLDCIERDNVSVVLQLGDKELTHLHSGNTFIKRAINRASEVAEIFDSIVRNHRDPDECVIIYTQKEYATLLSHMELKKNAAEGILVMSIERAQFTGRKYLYVIGLNDKELPVYDPQSKEILDNPEEVEEAYEGGYANEVIPLAKLLDVLGSHEGVTYLSYAIYDEVLCSGDVFLPSPFYSMLKSKISLEQYLENPE